MTELTLAASIAVREVYLSRIRELEAQLRRDPTDYEAAGVRFFLLRALVAECKEVSKCRT